MHPSNIKKGDAIETDKVVQEIKETTAAHHQFLVKNEIQRRKWKEQEKEEPLKENTNPFMFFPIKYHEVLQIQKNAEDLF